tara:strand:+ start:98 stop:277 length:180 start_codon:yes stop_codon:yes gene_type:complete
MIVSTTVIICLAIVIIMDYRTIKNLLKIVDNNEEYIATLEKRNREDMIYKNEQFNNKQK